LTLAGVDNADNMIIDQASDLRMTRVYILKDSILYSYFLYFNSVPLCTEERGNRDPSLNTGALASTR
jgi:hypothetical protein